MKMTIDKLKLISMEIERNIKTHRRLSDNVIFIQRSHTRRINIHVYTFKYVQYICKCINVYIYIYAMMHMYIHIYI
jgi:hypothetical protein